ncbi:MAG: hypothetical protein ACKOX7_07600, partial [Bacteroidota bacterium]
VGVRGALFGYRSLSMSKGGQAKSNNENGINPKIKTIYLYISLLKNTLSKLPNKKLLPIINHLWMLRQTF